MGSSTITTLVTTCCPNSPLPFCVDWPLSSFTIFLGSLAYQAPGVSPKGVLECLHRELVYSLAHSFVNIALGDEIFAFPQP